MAATMEQDRQAKAVERLAFFSDAVFAIAITLLIIEIQVPDDVPSAAVADAVRELVPSFLGFVVSFYVIARFWVTHHRLFQYLRSVDMGLVVLDLFLLMLVAFLPFSSGLFGRYPNERFVVLMQASAMFAVAVAASLTWQWALHRRPLIGARLRSVEWRVAKWRTLTLPAAFLLGVLAAAFGNTILTIFCWIVVTDLMLLAVGWWIRRRRA